MFCPRCHRELAREYRFCPYDGARTGEQPALGMVPVSHSQLTDALLGERYLIRGFIGRGAMARVYLAEDTESGRPVAVKVLDPLRGKDPAIRERFLREAETVALIGHPNIVQMLETGTRPDNGAPYLVMEFLFGESLGRFLEREGTMGPELGLPALRQAASALAAAHDKAVIHRDVKPDNLFLIGEPGDPYELKVLDFGFSKLQTSQLTAAGVTLGTPGYMAPEQVLGEEVDARTDVYALGMVMYRTFGGRSAFRSDDPFEILAHQLFTPPPRPSLLEARIDERTEQVILSAIRKDPRQRYPTMARFFDDLGRLGQPDAALWTAPSGQDRYEPKSRVGALAAEALERLLPSRWRGKG